MTFSLILDIVIAVLLIVTIAYAVGLNRKLALLRRDKAELEKMASNFGEATLRAGESISQLRSTADELQERIGSAVALRDDLAFLIDRGGSAADRLEDMVRAARKEGAVPVVPGAAAAAAAGPAEPAPGGEDEKGKGEANSEAERALMKALESAR